MKRALVVGALAITPLAFAPAAGAAPSEGSSCVAFFVHEPLGPPGQTQRIVHLRDGELGHNVAFIAREEHGNCFFPF